MTKLAMVLTGFFLLVISFMLWAARPQMPFTKNDFDRIKPYQTAPKDLAAILNVPPGDYTTAPMEEVDQLSTSLDMSSAAATSFVEWSTDEGDFIVGIRDGDIICTDHFARKKQSVSYPELLLWRMKRWWTRRVE